MIIKSLYWFIILLFTVLPFTSEIIMHRFTEIHFPFIWSLFLIPNILIMIMYPKWKVVIGSGIFYSLLKYIMELGIYPVSNKIEMSMLFLSSLVNWCVHLTVGYFRIEYDKMLKKVEKLTVIDPLTGLYNRRYFDLYMEKIIAISQRTKSPLLLILLDIDFFKDINDRYGHQCGDEALKHISKIIKNNVRKSDGYVRFGGEEFAIVLPNTSLGEGGRLAERIREVIEKTEFIYKNKPIKLTVSIGVSSYSGENVNQFIEITDKALYKAKENGRNQVVVSHE